MYWLCFNASATSPLAEGNVIIVIGGDDSYKNEDEEYREFISRWARRKISSQFSEEFLDGRKSFIFSWDKKHREIHEEALLHFFDPSKKGKKFECQPPKRKIPQPPTSPATSLPSRAAEPTGRLRPEESKSQQRRSESGPLRLDTLTLEDKPKTKDPYLITPIGHGTKENAAFYTEKADNLQGRGGNDTLERDTLAFKEKPKAKDTFLSASCREHATFNTEREGRFQETAPSKYQINRQKGKEISK